MACVIVAVFTIIGMMDRVCAQSPRTLEEALLNYTWEWTHAPKPPDVLVFGKDGIATCPRFAWHWKITGPRTAIAFDAIRGGGSGFKATLKFDENFTSLTAQTDDGRYHYTGKRMAAATGTAVVIAPPVQPTLPNKPGAADPTQPLLETLSQQAPNASAWVLAPLDAGVPPDIRQNVTYLREDLLDEAAKKPKASPEAYKVGEQLCNTMIAALDERDRTLARAGFHAVEANARTGVSSQALEARRNYKMSWPQFAREESQRAELKSQAVNSAAVMAERPKLEWSQRIDQIRPTLDALYKQFRAALRQSPPAK
jgi:hypothetical protein